MGVSLVALVVELLLALVVELLLVLVVELLIATVVAVGLGTGGEVKVSSADVAHLPLTMQVWPLGQHTLPQQVQPLRQHKTPGPGQRNEPAVHSSLTPMHVWPMGGQLTDGNGGGEGDGHR